MTKTLQSRLAGIDVINLIRQWDRDGNGELSKREMRRGLQRLGMEMVSDDFEAVFEAIDTDGNGKISQEELANFANSAFSEQSIDARYLYNKQKLNQRMAAREQSTADHISEIYAAKTQRRKVKTAAQLAKMDIHTPNGPADATAAAKKRVRAFIVARDTRYEHKWESERHAKVMARQNELRRQWESGAQLGRPGLGLGGASFADAFHCSV